MFENFKKKREFREIKRLNLLLINKDDNTRNEIKQQISLCKYLNWKEYKIFKQY